MGKEKICFVICPIGKPASEVRERSDQIFNHIITPVAKPLGYKPIRSDHISTPGIITNQVMTHVVKSQLVIADLTGHNANVFYELAIRHGIRRPFIQMIRDGERIPFDVAGMRTIYVDVHNLNSVEEAKQELEKAIKSLGEDRPEIHTPISVAIDLEILRQSEDPKQLLLADIREAISELGSRILGLETILTTPKIELGPQSLYNLRGTPYGGLSEPSGTFYGGLGDPSGTSYGGPSGLTGPQAEYPSIRVGAPTMIMPSGYVVDPAFKRGLAEIAELLSSIPEGKREESPEIDEVERKLESLRNKMLTLGE